MAWDFFILATNHCRSVRQVAAKDNLSQHIERKSRPYFQTLGQTCLWATKQTAEMVQVHCTGNVPKDGVPKDPPVLHQIAWPSDSLQME